MGGGQTLKPLSLANLTNWRIYMLIEAFEVAKARHPGRLLLFRHGSGYRLFGEHAEAAGITLNRLVEADGDLATLTLDAKRLEVQLACLLRAGYLLAVCDEG
jgi:DNA mismatch repair ATPase MutS